MADPVLLLPLLAAVGLVTAGHLGWYALRLDDKPRERYEVRSNVRLLVGPYDWSEEA